MSEKQLNDLLCDKLNLSFISDDLFKTIFEPIKNNPYYLLLMNNINFEGEQQLFDLANNLFDEFVKNYEEEIYPEMVSESKYNREYVYSFENRILSTPALIDVLRKLLILKLSYLKKDISEKSSWDLNYIYFNDAYPPGDEPDNYIENYERSYEGDIILNLSIKGYEPSLYHHLNLMYDDISDFTRRVYDNVRGKTANV